LLLEAEKLFDVDRNDALLVIFFSQDEVFIRIFKLLFKVPSVDDLASNVFIETATNISFI